MKMRKGKKKIAKVKSAVKTKEKRKEKNTVKIK